MAWKLTPIVHHGEKRIKVDFPNNAAQNQRIRRIQGAKWSSSLKAWHVANTPENEALLKLETQNIPNLEPDSTTVQNALQSTISSSQPNGETERPLETLPVDIVNKLEKYERWLNNRRYSQNTVKTYTQALRSFLKFHSQKKIQEITNDDIIEYNTKYILRHNLSATYQNQVVNAIKLFFSKIEGTKIQVELIERPKKAKLLPNVLSKEEVKMILNALVNTKHIAMLSLIYSCGLRRSELINLKPSDIDSKRKIIIIRQGKGRKDRIAPLSDKIIELLRRYYVGYRPKFWLFEGQVKGTQYDERSLASVLKQALAKTSIKKPVSLHWLRHSYATHLLEAGTDLRYIQEILGHQSSRTTEIYTHVSTKNIQNIKSPFDDL
jgi:integrase/recombinase XerD